MKLPRNPVGLQIAAQWLAMALLPIGLLTAVLTAWSAWTPQLAAAMEAAAGAAFGVSALLGLGLGVREQRRAARLAESAHRMANRDFSHPIPVDGRDTTALLARTTNDLARHLIATLSAQQVFAEIDEAILGRIDLAALVRGSLRGLRLATHGEVAVLGLFDPEADDTVELFWTRKADRNTIQNARLAMTPEARRRLPAIPQGRSVPHAPLPPDFEAQLRKGAGVDHFLTVPIVHEDRVHGFLLSGHGASASLGEEATRLLGGVAARLVAGLAWAERERRLVALGSVDSLTGLPNRTALLDLLAKALARAEHENAPLAIVLIDLDRFKQANDAFGHDIGDRLLVQAANRIRNSVREDDLVARIGGDKFAVVLASAALPREAAAAARQLIQSLSRRFDIEGKTIFIGASAGIALHPDDGSDGAELLKKADTAMYRAKSEGRSRFVFFEEPMHAESQQRSVLDGELRRALVKGEFVLHYQPQIDLRTGALAGVEALIRWQHPARGLLYPKDFIEFAEEIGLIPEIGAWVMMAACRQHQLWRNEGTRVPRVSVNVSNGQLPRSNFIAGVRHIIASSGIAPGSLEVEVTESMLFEGGKAATEALDQMAADGMLIAIDDFGTGYSSFSQLKTIPAHVIKLDMSFLAGATASNDAGKIVAAIVNMAHALHKEVVAEGVESVEQLKLLKHLGCERGQGYLFGKPVPAEHIRRIFRAEGNAALPQPPGPVALPVQEAAAAVRAAIAPATPPAPARAPAEMDNRGEPATVLLPLSDCDVLTRVSQSHPQNGC